MVQIEGLTTFIFSFFVPPPPASNKNHVIVLLEMCRVETWRVSDYHTSPVDSSGNAWHKQYFRIGCSISRNTKKDFFLYFKNQLNTKLSRK